MRHFSLAVAIALIATLAFGSIALAQAGPEFRPGFKALADQIPAIVGVPLENEHTEANGDVIQRTTTGLMVWRASDRWTMFTNGSVTWILGPYGLQSRLNTQLYPWEWVPPAPAPVTSGAPSSGGSTPTAQPTPAPAPAVVAPTPTPAPPPPTATPVPPTPAPPTNRTYAPDVKGMDDQAGAHGVMVKSFLQSVDQEWLRVWGWRPHKPTTVYLYTDGWGFAGGYAQITGASMSWDDMERMATLGAVARGNDTLTGGWAIFMNLNYKYGTEDWESTMQALLLHEYTYIFETDLAGDAGPQWFREGVAEWSAYSKVTDSPAEKSVVYYAGVALKNGSLPSLLTLNSSWNETVNSSSVSSEAAYGASYLAVKYLASRVGGMPLMQALQRAAAGEDFDTALQRATGYSIARLESEYRNTIPAP